MVEFCLSSPDEDEAFQYHFVVVSKNDQLLSAFIMVFTYAAKQYAEFSVLNTLHQATRNTSVVCYCASIKYCFFTLSVDHKNK